MNNNQIEYQVWGKYALFTDPVTRIGGEKSSYHIPTYEALKGITESIYWRPTIIWVIDEVRIIKAIQTYTKSIKTIKYHDGTKSGLAYYTYLTDVAYQVKAHYEWNLYRKDMAQDRIESKHTKIADRMVVKGGRRDIFLGTRECQGYIKPCTLGKGKGFYDEIKELAYGLTFHGFDYPDEIGKDELHSRFWKPIMGNGVIKFDPPQKCNIRKFVRKMTPNPPKAKILCEKEF